jgi:hypothetical protein
MHSVAMGFILHSKKFVKSCHNLVVYQFWYLNCKHPLPRMISSFRRGANVIRDLLGFYAAQIGS